MLRKLFWLVIFTVFLGKKVFDLDLHSAPPAYFDYYSYQFRISLQQSLFNLPSWVEYSQSNLKAQMAESKLTFEELELIKRVFEAYFNFLYVMDYLKVLQEEKKLSLSNFSMVKKLFSAEEATLTDIHDAEARYSDILFKIVTAEKELYLAKNRLSRLIGVIKDKLEKTEIKALEDGIVMNLRIHTVGGVIRPAEPILEIVPGMPVQAVVKTGKTTFLSYLLKPFLDRLTVSFLK